MRAEYNDDEGIGLSFARSSARTTVGAAIIHERTAAFSKGSLNFYTKQTAAEDPDPVLCLKLGDDGKVGVGTGTAAYKLDVTDGDLRILAMTATMAAMIEQS